MTMLVLPPPGRLPRGIAMRCDPLIWKARVKFVTGAVLMCFAAASTAVTLVGGGSTLPAIAYTAHAAPPFTFAPITPASVSLFGGYTIATGNGITYCPTGTGEGKKILAGNDPTNFQVNGRCGETFSFVPVGFTLGGTNLAQADFAGSEAPLSLSEYSAYRVGHGVDSQPVQLPSIAGAIAIVFRKDANPFIGSSVVNSLTLSEAQICGIFSGQITDWSALVPGTAGPINVPSSAFSSARPPMLIW